MTQRRGEAEKRGDGLGFGNFCDSSVLMPYARILPLYQIIRNARRRNSRSEARWMKMIPATIDSVRIRGFRSLKDVEISGLPKAAVMIGANGSGKSNFIRFFEMLSWMLRAQRLGEFVGRHGGADDQLYGGNAVTPRMDAEIALRTEQGRNDYRFALAYAHPDRFMFIEESFRSLSDGSPCSERSWQRFGSGHFEALLPDAAQTLGHFGGLNTTTARVIVNLLRDCAAYQFHDTSFRSSLKMNWDVTENHSLRSDGGNLAPILHRLEQEDLARYNLICRHIRRMLPIFERFVLNESYGKVYLRWQAKGMDKTIGAHLTSDGSLRLFALITLLNLPGEMLPNVILLDEPELGLHPSAVSLVGGMISSLSEERQVIVATQSPLLVDSFQLEEIIVTEMEDGQTRFRKLKSDEYRHWLEDGYSSGDLWQTNLLGGRP